MAAELDLLGSRESEDSLGLESRGWAPRCVSSEARPVSCDAQEAGQEDSKPVVLEPGMEGRR